MRNFFRSPPPAVHWFMAGMLMMGAVHSLARGEVLWAACGFALCLSSVWAARDSVYA